MKSLAVGLLVLGVQSAVADTPEAIENVAAIGAAQAECGLEIDTETVNLAVASLFSNPADLSQGGRHYEALHENLRRIAELTSMRH